MLVVDFQLQLQLKLKPKNLKKKPLTKREIEAALAKSAAGVKDLDPGLRATFGPWKGRLS
jgi:hypothetical protein